MISKELAQQALDALENCAESLAFAADRIGICGEGDGPDHRADAPDDIGSGPALRSSRAAVNALRAAIAQPESEPVATIHVNRINGYSSAILLNRRTLHHGDLLYTHPPTVAYVPLTDELISELWTDAWASENDDECLYFARAIELAVRGEPKPLVWGEFDGKDDLK